MDSSLDLEISASCSPDSEFSALQAIDLVARTPQGDLVCELAALRLADPFFDIESPASLIEAFDLHTAVAHSFATEVFRTRKALTKRYGEDGIFSLGFIAILSVRTSGQFRGHRTGLRLLRYLREIHAGMQWYAGLQAAPQEVEPGSPVYRALRRRLINYYSSDQTLGLIEDAPKASPGFMTTLWQ